MPGEMNELLGRLFIFLLLIRERIKTTCVMLNSDSNVTYAECPGRIKREKFIDIFNAVFCSPLYIFFSRAWNGRWSGEFAKKKSWNAWFRNWIYILCYAVMKRGFKSCICPMVIEIFMNINWDSGYSAVLFLEYVIESSKAQAHIFKIMNSLSETSAGFTLKFLSAFFLPARKLSSQSPSPYLRTSNQ